MRNKVITIIGLMLALFFLAGFFPRLIFSIGLICLVLFLISFFYAIFSFLFNKNIRPLKGSAVLFCIMITCMSAANSVESKPLKNEIHVENESKQDTTNTNSSGKINRSNFSHESNESESTEESIQSKSTISPQYLANLNFSDVQTITINNGVPDFSPIDLNIDNGPWQKYGELDALNRASAAEALLNQSLMPTAKRTDISKVLPTGWHNKRIKGGYLYNRSHLIGFALTGQNANWKNLITGTRQLNSPEMLRYEMDIKYYLEKKSDNYVRYRVTPVFRGSELLARGVHMEAQSIGDEEIKFNIYIFNVQDGVILNYNDGTSQIKDN